METFAEVLNKNLNMHPDPTKEQFELTLDGLHQLLTELERPQNHELMRFVVGWQKLEKEPAIDGLFDCLRRGKSHIPISN
jgi:hypothetical protein